MAGHAGDGVIEHDGNDAALVVDNLCRAGHAAVEKGGVAKDTEDLLVLTGDVKGLGHAHADAEASAHAHDAVERVEGSRAAESIAADVARDDEVLVLCHRIEEAAVRAAGAESGRTGHGGDADVHCLRLLAEDALAQELGVELIELAGHGLALAGDSRGEDLGLHEAVELFDDIELIDLGGKVTDKLDGQRVCQPELEEGGVLGESVLCVLIRDGRGDDADLSAVYLHAVERRSAGIFFKRLHILFELGVIHHRVCRGGDVFARVAHILRHRALLACAEGDKALGVRDSGRRAQQHGHIELFGYLIGRAHEVKALLRIRGLDHGKARCARIVPAVLLILGGVHARVVRDDDNEAAAHAVVSCGEHRVGRDVQTDVLHRAQAAHTGKACPVCHLGRDFLVRRPFAVQIVLVLRERLEDLGAGRAGICRAHLYTGFIRAARKGFIA